MTAPAAVSPSRAILRADALRVARDRFMLGTAVYIVAIAVAMRWLLPFATDELAARVGFDLTPYYALVISHVMVQLTPLIGGMIGGFLLLESKESGVIRALRVTPVPMTRHLFVLGGAMIAAGFALVLFETLAVGIAVPPAPALIAIALAGAPAAVIFALFIGIIADTKTEAFAYSKFVALMPLVSSGAWFLAEPWQYVAGIYPPYWASKAYWLAIEGDPAWPLAVAAGLALSAVWLYAMGRLFVRRVRG